MYISQQHHLLNKNNDIVQAKGTYCTMHNKVLLSTPIIKVLCACLMLCSLYLSVTMYTVMSLLDDFTVLIALLAFTWLYKCHLKQSRVSVALCTYATALVLQGTCLFCIGYHSFCKQCLHTYRLPKLLGKLPFYIIYTLCIQKYLAVYKTNNTTTEIHSHIHFKTYSLHAQTLTVIFGYKNMYEIAAASTKM